MNISQRHQIFQSGCSAKYNKDTKPGARYKGLQRNSYSYSIADHRDLPQTHRPTRTGNHQGLPKGTPKGGTRHTKRRYEPPSPSRPPPAEPDAGPERREPTPAREDPPESLVAALEAPTDGWKPLIWYTWTAGELVVSWARGCTTLIAPAQCAR